jgi:hypothetical protein
MNFRQSSDISGCHINNELERCKPKAKKDHLEWGKSSNQGNR